MTILGALLGSYRVTDELSSGGMGTVFRARHELLGKPAAVKLLRPELTARPELVQRFFTEAKAASAIRHPGIVDVFDFGYTTDHRAYIVMELLEGETLFDRIARGRLAELDAGRIARGIASALSAAHATGIVHRDLKPDNVFLVPDPDVPGGERAKVLDFGIAKLVDPSGAPVGSQHTQTGTLVGTPLYMAPEQARAASTIDHRADLYSLGCILYEMLVGTPPFDAAEGTGAIITAHLFGEVIPPRAKRPELSQAIDAIVMRLLQKEPNDRFASAGDVTAALDRAFVAAETRQWPAPSLQIPVADDAPPRRRSMMPLVAGLVTLAVVVGGVILFALQRAGAPAPEPPPATPPPALVREVPPPPPVAPPPPPETTAAPAGEAKPPIKGVTPHTPKKLKPCDGHKGDHTGNCSPIETAPL